MKSSFIPISIALTLFMIAGGAYSMWYGMVAAESARSAQEVAVISKQSETQKRTQALVAALAKLESSERTVREYFVTETNIVDFLKNIEQVGTSLGAKVETISVSPVSTKGDPTISINLSVSGSFQAVMQTLGAIEFAPFALTMPSIHLSHAEKNWSAAVVIAVGSMVTPPKTVSTSTPPSIKKL